MADLINNCSSPFQPLIPSCTDTLRVSAGLSPDTNYIWRVVDKFDNHYTGAVTTDENGDFEIDVATYLPRYLLMPYSGAVVLTVELPDAPGTPVTLTLCEVDYTQIQLSGYSQADAGSTFTIPVCPAEGEGA
jgi:hypothetical protein